ncbi:MAG: hypothetical protein ACK5SU_05240 [Phenylobacterium sp.]|jgi:hypothetical protein
MKALLIPMLALAGAFLAVWSPGSLLPATREPVSSQTLLEVRTATSTSSPVGRIFIDPEAFAKTSLDELAAEVARRQRGAS